MRVSLLLNWALNPYHTPIIVAKEMGFYQQHGIELSILEPTDPSDVTKIIGQKQITLGLKAMVHCYAARNRGFNLTSIGTLLDEPPTGLISLKEKKLNSVQDFKGKRLGYVGEFGKVMIDELARTANLDTSEYSTHRIGMEATSAILSDKVDAAIGLSCFQQIEIEEQGKETQLLRIDRLAHLGCCCFCSILFITHEDFIEKEKALFGDFMAATHLGMEVTRELPSEALAILRKAKSCFDSPLYTKIFSAMLPFFSKSLQNVERDWQKVAFYAKQLGIASQNDNSLMYTNQFLPAL